MERRQIEWNQMEQRQMRSNGIGTKLIETICNAMKWSTIKRNEFEMKRPNSCDIKMVACVWTCNIIFREWN